MSPDKDILGVSTSLLTVLALAATSKIWVLGLPILLVVDAVEELRSQGAPLVLRRNANSFSNDSSPCLRYSQRRHSAFRSCVELRKIFRLR